MWDVLKAHEAQAPRIVDLFSQDAARSDAFSITSDGIHFDFAKTNITPTCWRDLIKLAEAAELPKWRDAMFAGEKINTTEGRAVLHTALRNLSGGAVMVNGVDVMPGVQAGLAKMSDFAARVRSGDFSGQGGKITDIVNIGIGGSDLGPVMATLALRPYADGPRTHFISNVDGADLTDTLADLDPATTLVLVASKTFTTQETMMNAASVRQWMAGSVSDPAVQFAAISTNLQATEAFGIPADRVFGFEDWVGGRYSMWGPIGLSLMIAIGINDFNAFLSGAHAMDQHFLTSPLDENMPVALALVGIWHHQICDHATRAVLPYEQRLLRFPAYLQQMEMESNGKRVSRDGQELEQTVGPVVWGEPGTNGQHAFYQLIHQGRQVVPCEFLVGAESHEPALAQHHKAILANCLAQSEALLLGRSYEVAHERMSAKGYEGAELEAHAMQRVFPGNRPSTTLIYPKLTPYVLGQIVALYEHRVFVEGVILGINSYDQWGVELGKELANKLLPAVEAGADLSEVHPATRALLKQINQAR